MTHRTQLSQADEALRQAVPSPDARTVLAKMAERLRTIRPGGDLEDSRRLALILRFSVDQRPRDLDAAEELEHEVRAFAPRITEDVTRGEYALILDRAAGTGR